MPLLELDGLGKSFGRLRVLDDISLSLEAGEVHCLLGENGAGKSTLCNLIFGVHAPDGGTMKLDGAPYRPARPADALAQGIAMVHQHFSLVPDVSVVDNLLLGQSRGVLKRAECAERMQALGQRYGMPLDPYAKVSDLSVGERQRVEIVKCLMREPRLLVLDEPTAVLLPDEIQALLQVCQRVAEQGCGVVLVTHKLAEIRQVARRATVLRGGRIVARSDQPAEDITSLVRAMIQRDLADPSDVLPAAPARAATPSGEAEPVPALMVDGLTVRDAQGVTRLDNFTVMVAPGEIVGVAGVEGNGQVELAGVLSGLMDNTEGRFFVAGEDLTGRSAGAITAAGVGIVPEDRHASGCVTQMSVAENMLLNRLGDYRRWGLLDRAALKRDAQQLMLTYDVRAAGPDAAFSGLSGGNQQKAVLARELTTDGLKFLMAAQPTRGLDVGAVEAVYGHIVGACARGVGVLLISSELDELLHVADRILVLYRGRIMGECEAHASQRERIGAWMAGQTQ
ncbi:ATP-binding cassette domain-containing protein [Xylophilus rhododendri]|uniref:ATP-binding cassette domain-containing protein n=1 Tax=Xylophilus rhododendri TaxID=2697032 RepID=A0A857J1J8_9BURK|nr:ABC transporter ATP-binding protein [Xylophilus rhododendri]QHI97576.1 ATP-binding cassette domain-containing protein [Xylophilus rhododendri]